MSATYTARNRLTKQADGSNENTWGDVVNTVLDLVDDSLDGRETINVGVANQTLTSVDGAADESRVRYLKITGTPSATRVVTVPDVEKWYFVEMALSDASSVTFKNASGTGVTLTQGDKGIFICDGSDVEAFLKQIDVDALVPSNNLSDLTDVGDARTNLGLGDLATKNQTTLLEAIYPVDSVYINAGNPTNPGTLLGFGTWSAFGPGRVLVGVGTGTDDNAVDKTFAAGSTEGEYSHTLTEGEMPSHTHEVFFDNSAGAGDGDPKPRNTSSSQNVTSGSAGGDQAHNNIQPSIAVYMWRRDS